MRLWVVERLLLLVILVGVLITIAALPALQPAPTLPSGLATTNPSAHAAGTTASATAPLAASTTDQPGAAVLAAFWGVVEDLRLSYHLSGNGSSIYLGQEFESFTLELDIDGDDYAGRVNTIGGSGKARIIRKDGVMYIRRAGGSWVGLESTDATFLQVPFMGIDSRTALVYDGEVSEGDRTLHRLISTDTYRPSITRMLDLARFDASPDAVRLEVFVTSAGVPKRASFRCEARGLDAAGNPQFVGTANYEFTELGARFTISAP